MVNELAINEVSASYTPGNAIKTNRLAPCLELLFAPYSLVSSLPSLNARGPAPSTRGNTLGEPRELSAKTIGSREVANN